MTKMLHADEVSPDAIVTALNSLSGGFHRLEQVVDKMAESINRLAIMEERQLADRQAVERAFNEIAELKKQLATTREKIVDTEKQLLLHGRTNVWVERAVWAAACAAVLAVASGKHII